MRYKNSTLSSQRCRYFKGRLINEAFRGSNMEKKFTNLSDHLLRPRITHLFFDFHLR